MRDANKKHIQRRALIDLLKFLKEQGLQQNFSLTPTPFLVEAQVLADRAFAGYYYKSHEVGLMLASASQASEQADLRNADILRMRGFAQSLLLKILQLNKDVAAVQELLKKLGRMRAPEGFRAFTQEQ